MVSVVQSIHLACRSVAVNSLNCQSVILLRYNILVFQKDDILLDDVEGNSKRYHLRYIIQLYISPVFVWVGEGGRGVIGESVITGEDKLRLKFLHRIQHDGSCCIYITQKPYYT